MAPMDRRPDEGGQRGAATVELALVLPVLLAVVGLVIGAGWLGAVQAVLDHGAREGARYAAVGDGWDYPDGAAVTGAVDRATPLLTPSAVAVSTDGPGANAPVRVEVSYEVANPVAVLFAPLSALGFAEPVPPSLTLRSSAEARRE